MDKNRVLTSVLALTMFLSLSACGDAGDSSGDTQTTAEPAVTAEAGSESSSAEEVTESAAEETGDTALTDPAPADYDVSAGPKLYEELKEKYYGDYTLSFATEGMTFTTSIKDGKVYSAQVVSGMKSYFVVPGDGKEYIVYEATTTYTSMDADEFNISDEDVLFGWEEEFGVTGSSAEIDPDTGWVAEHFQLEGEDGGEVIFYFGGEDLALKRIEERGEIPVVLDEITLGEGDESLVEVPDLSAYTEE